MSATASCLRSHARHRRAASAPERAEVIAALHLLAAAADTGVSTVSPTRSTMARRSSSSHGCQSRNSMPGALHNAGNSFIWARPWNALAAGWNSNPGGVAARRWRGARCCRSFSRWTERFPGRGRLLCSDGPRIRAVPGACSQYGQPLRWPWPESGRAECNASRTNLAGAVARFSGMRPASSD